MDKVDEIGRKVLTVFTDQQLEQELKQRQAWKAQAAEERAQCGRQPSIDPDTPFYLLALESQEDPVVLPEDLQRVRLTRRLYLYERVDDAWGGRTLDWDAGALDGAGPDRPEAYDKALNELTYVLAGHDLSFCRVYRRFDDAQQAMQALVEEHLESTRQSLRDIQQLREEDIPEVSVQAQGWD